MVQPIVVKRSDIAQANETLETLKAYQLYEACLVGDTNIFNFEITPQILARYIDRSQVKTYINDLANLPSDVKRLMVNDLSDQVLANYEEKNEYYRMLSGLPELEDNASDFIYVRDMEEYGIPTNVPIHQ